MNFKNMKMAFQILVLIFHLSEEYELTESRAMQVSNSLPPETEECFMLEQLMFLENMHGCLMLCQQNPPCLLACRIGKRCRLYSANVSRQWAGISPNDPELVDAVCYSLWADAKDLMPLATITSSEMFFTSDPPEAAGDGFSCILINKYRLVLNRKVYAWATFDLGSQYIIDKVVVQLRGDGSSFFFLPEFKDVEVRIGNNEIQEANPLFMLYNGSSDNYAEVVTFKSVVPFPGRYVHFRRMDNAELVFMEVKILSV